ncbi:MAG: NAD(+) diphosphatase [Treponema sp.]|nr:NAD(+) diphosphatase [Treponema sp.]
MILLGNCTFFFQGASLLAPQGVSADTVYPDIPLSHAEQFPFSDIFTIPAGVSDAAQGDISCGVISCVSVPAEAPLPPFWQAIPVRQALSAFSGSLTEETGPADTLSPVSRLLRAFHIAQWRRESLFCGSCGAKNTDASAANGGGHPAEVARLCPACGRMEFPRIAPAVITLITNDEGKTLLAHNRKFAPGVYSLIAGFVEAGENLEAAAARETREETGIEIGDIRYIASQPWPFPHSLMIGFSARYTAGTIRPDGVEIEDAQWFSRDNLPLLPGPGSVSRYLIGRWLDGTL